MVKVELQDSAAPVDQMGNQTSQDPGGTLALLELKGMKVRRYSFSLRKKRRRRIGTVFTVLLSNPFFAHSLLRGRQFKQQSLL